MCTTLSRVPPEPEGSLDSFSSSPKGIIKAKGIQNFESEHNSTIISTQWPVNPLIWYSGAAQRSLARKLHIQRSFFILRLITKANYLNKHLS